MTERNLDKFSLFLFCFETKFIFDVVSVSFSVLKRRFCFLLLLLLATLIVCCLDRVQQVSLAPKSLILEDNLCLWLTKILWIDSEFFCVL
jgi:hypothetical protein